MLHTKRKCGDQCQGLLNQLINQVPQFHIHWVIKEMNTSK